MNAQYNGTMILLCFAPFDKPMKSILLLSQVDSDIADFVYLYGKRYANNNVTSFAEVFARIINISPVQMKMIYDRL